MVTLPWGYAHMSPRKLISSRTGYVNFFANLSDYESSLDNAPRSWSVVPAVRHAMASHPHSKYFFHLDAHALFMNPTKSLESALLDNRRLESLMRKDVPVVPPDSIIKTFSHLQPQDIDLIVSTDNEDLSAGSFIVKQGEFARFFLDFWFDPLYRGYNFAKAEIHALVRDLPPHNLWGMSLHSHDANCLVFRLQDHIVQWHPTVLARLALIPQRVINAYSKDSSDAAIDGTYKDGDLVLRLFGCETDAKRNCEKEMEPYYHLWAKNLKKE